MEYAVTMAEAPEEISLTIAVSNCAFRCSGCHSAYLWEDKGVLLLPVLPNSSAGIPDSSLACASWEKAKIPQSSGRHW